MIENIYDFVTGMQDGYKARCGWGFGPRGSGTRQTRRFYWDGYLATSDRATDGMLVAQAMGRA